MPVHNLSPKELMLQKGAMCAWCVCVTQTEERSDYAG